MKLILIVLLMQMRGICSLSSINTIPPSPSNVLATGYPGLIVNVQFEKGSKSSCVWRFVGNIKSLDIFLPTFPCGPRNSASESSSCVEEIINGVNHITSNLTFHQPLSSGILGVYVGCDASVSSSVNFTLPTKTIRNCPHTLSNNVIVESSSNIFNANGRFSCSYNGKLFYSNGNQLQSIETTCLASAKWSGQDNLQCWTAPIVSTQVPDNLNKIQGENLTLTCQYNDVFPTGTSSVFYIDGIGIVKPKGQPHTLTSLQPTDNNKVVSCQAVTSYTQIFNDTGRSIQYAINVQFAPYQNLSTNRPCIWYSGHAASCAIPFYSNPSSTVVSLEKVGSVVAIPGSFNLSNLPNSLQEFYYRRYQVTREDNGTYALHLRSSLSQLTIVFDIIVIDETPTKSPSQTALIIGLTCAGVAILVALVVVLAVFMRRKHQSKQRQKTLVISYDQNAGASNQGTSANAQVTSQPCTKKPAAAPDYVNLQENVEVSRDEFGYLTLTAVGPPETSAASNYENISKSEYEDLEVPHPVTVLPTDDSGYVTLTPDQQQQGRGNFKK